MQTFNVRIIRERNNNGECDKLLQIENDTKKIGIYNCLTHPLSEFMEPVGFIGDVYDALGNTRKGNLYKVSMNKWVLDVDTDEELSYYDAFICKMPQKEISTSLASNAPQVDENTEGAMDEDSDVETNNNNNMIPKVIHYCWFGRNPLPESAKKCIASWRKFLPDYEIKEWNEDNFDVNIIPYTAEAYRMKKYAFVSDYARFWILYKYGGLYFDTDVEVIRPMDDIIARGPFMGCENAYDPSKDTGATTLGVAPGLGLGVNPGLGLYAEILEMYKGEHFIDKDGKQNPNTVVDYTTKILVNHGLQYRGDIQECAGVWIYPDEYFCPLSRFTGKLVITENTCSIHHYDATWMDKKGKLATYIKLHYGENVFEILCKIKGIFIKRKNKK